MSTVALLLICSTLIFVISQFGSRLAARNSIVWWAIAVFIIIASINPELLHPITETLGIKVVSNFVLASLIMFLFLQLLELTAEATLQSRKMRFLVASFAADEYVQKNTPSSFEGGIPTKVLVVLPCYNEEEALEDTINQIEKFLATANEVKGLEFHACFINDGSTDSSARILAKRCPRNFTSHRVNVGVAGVLLTGFEIGKQINADFVVQCDSDGQHPIELIPSLVKHAQEHKLDLLVGSRFAPSAKMVASVNVGESTTKARITGIQVIRSMLRIFGARAFIFDPTSGFRVYSKFGQATLTQFMPDEYPEPESIAILALRNGKIGEYPVRMLPRTTGVSSISGLKTLRFMVKVLTALLGLRLRTLLTSRFSNV